MKNIISFFLPVVFLIMSSACNKDSVIIETTPPTPTNQSVSGTAFFDLNGNGEGEAPMINAKVYLGDSLLVSSPNFSCDSLISPGILETTVDLNGDYSFEGVNPRENQVLRICPLEAVSDLVGVDNDLDGDLNEDLTNGLIQITIEEDENDEGNDFVGFKLPTLISGYVLEDTDGDLIGDIPEEGRNMWLQNRDADGNPVGDRIGSAVTDENGYYEFTDIPSGEYVVIAVVFFSQPVVCVTSIDQSPESGEPTNNRDCIYINVNITEEITRDEDNVFVLAQKIPTISGYVLEDIDQDSIGDLPLTAHWLELYERTSTGEPMGPLVRSTISLSDGQYEFYNVPPGEYVISHIGRSDRPHECLVNMDQSPEPGEPTANAACSFISVNLPDPVVEDKDNVFVVTTLPIPGRLSGTIFEDITSDGQPDEETDIIVNIDVYERDNDGFITGPVLYTTESNSDGSFVFEEIMPGDYAVTLSQVSTSFNIIFGSADTGEPQPLPDVFPFTITSGDIISDAYFWIYTMDNVPSISGQVNEDTNGDGMGDTPQLDHVVELYLRGPDNLRTGDVLYKTNTTNGGNFYFTNLSTDDFILVLTGSNIYICSSSEDTSPEPGEPSSTSGCQFIPVNFVEGTVDEDNNFVVFEN